MSHQSSFQTLELELEGPVAVLTINRPEKRNALNALALRELGQAVERIASDAGVRGAIVTGAGERAFVAGADIAELAALEPLAAVELSRTGQAVFRAIEQSPKPFIAAVNGAALGGGCELALACHLRLAVPEARFGLPEVGLGTLPGFGGTVRLPRLVGVGRALEMILSGKPIDAAEAYRIGLVNRVVPVEDLLSQARSLVEAIAANAPLAVTLAMESVGRGADLSAGAALDAESTLFGILAGTEDMREGTAAFLEKRRPRFTGR